MRNELSRRQTQRKYPPGTFLTARDGHCVRLVLGYARAIHKSCDNASGDRRDGTHWEVIVLEEGSIKRFSWMQLLNMPFLGDWDE